MKHILVRLIVDISRVMGLDGSHDATKANVSFIGTQVNVSPLASAKASFDPFQEHKPEEEVASIHPELSVRSLTFWRLLSLYTTTG